MPSLVSSSDSDLPSLPPALSDDDESLPPSLCDEFDSLSDDEQPMEAEVKGFYVPSPHEARQLIAAPVPCKHDIAEFYSPPRVLAAARDMGQVGNISLDLTTGWNFHCGSLRALSCQLLTALCIGLLVLSPPCTMFSQLQWLWNVKKMTQEYFNLRMIEARQYIKHSMECARIQVLEGRRFVFEQPAGAKSWNEPDVRNVEALDGVQIVTVDQCMLGLKSKAGIPMRKRTKLMTNCHVLAQRFRAVGLCDGSHEHQTIQGQEGGVRRSVWAQRYPELMCQLIAKPV